VGDLLPIFIKEIIKTTVVIFSCSQERVVRSVLTHEESKDEDAIALVLENNHYKYIDRASCDKKIWDKWVTSTTPKPADHRKPTITLTFKTELTTKRIMEKKNLMKCKDEFNVVYKSATKLIDIVKRVNRNADKEVQEIGTDNNGKTKVCGVVYQFKCKLCADKGINSVYVGETGRSLRERCAEHCRVVSTEKLGTNDVSAIGEHDLKKHGKQPTLSSWDVEVLYKETNTQYRKTIEAYYIRNRNPTENRDKGVQIIATDQCFI
jgi:hypothetical protein